MYLRIFLVGLIIYLIIRLFMPSKSSNASRDKQDIKNKNGSKKVSKDTGDYVDYEEVDD